MLVMRRFEENILDLAAKGARFGNFHVYIGQEGTGAPVLEAATPADFLTTHHRNHGHVVGRGADPERIFAEILGRGSGTLGGRGGGLHLCDPSMNILQTSAIVGGSISLVIGAGHAIKQSGDDRVAIAFFGDSAMEEGVAYEALSIASLWKLPVIFVCENNSPGAAGVTDGGAPTLVHAAERLTRVPEILGITTYRIGDGADAAEVYAIATEARRHCREGKGPVFIEALTVRWPGSQKIIPKSAGATDIRIGLGEADYASAYAAWEQPHDPVLRWARTLKDRGDIGRDEIIALDAEIAARMSSAAQVAFDSPPPDPATAFDRVFA
jgi:pyruvate dehydrogenase E1 component alpha subunit